MSTRALAAVLAVVGLEACGYTVVNAGPPFGAQRVAVVPFVEEEPLGIAADLAGELAQRLGASGVVLVTDRAGADAVLTGRIEPAVLGYAPIPSPTAPVTLFHVTVHVNVVLTRGKTELWRARIAAGDDYQPVDAGQYWTQASGVDLGTESRRREALRRVSRGLARTIGEQLAVASATSAPGLAPPPPPAPKSTAPQPTRPQPGAPAPATPAPAATSAPGAPALPAPTPPATTTPSTPAPGLPMPPPGAATPNPPG